MYAGDNAFGHEYALSAPELTTKDAVTIGSEVHGWHDRGSLPVEVTYIAIGKPHKL
jgi:hypothetical protein